MCACVHVSVRVCLINAVSIRRREWEGEKNTGYSYRQRQRLGRARERQRREGARGELRQRESHLRTVRVGKDN